MVVGQDQLAHARLFLDARGDRAHACGQDRGQHAAVAGFDELHGGDRLAGQQRGARHRACQVGDGVRAGAALDVARAEGGLRPVLPAEVFGSRDLAEADVGLGHQHLGHADGHFLGDDPGRLVDEASTRRRTRPGRTRPQWPRPAIVPASSRTGPFDRRDRSRSVLSPGSMCARNRQWAVNCRRKTGLAGRRFAHPMNDDLTGVAYRPQPIRLANQDVVG